MSGTKSGQAVLMKRIFNKNFLCVRPISFRTFYAHRAESSKLKQNHREEARLQIIMIKPLLVQ